MTNQEFSNTFTTLLNSYNTQAQFGESASKREIVLDEYEKSVLLTQAQDIIVKSYFDAQTNSSQEGFDDSTRRQIDFSSLIKVATLKRYEKTTGSETTYGQSFDDRGIIFFLPRKKDEEGEDIEDTTDVLFILNEKITVTVTEDSYTGTSSLICKYAKEGNYDYIIVPISYKEYDREMSKPYAQPLKKQAWRLFHNQATGFDVNTELIPNINTISNIMNFPGTAKIDFWEEDGVKCYLKGAVETTTSQGTTITGTKAIIKGAYKIRYVKRPRPIILEDLPNNLEIDGCTKESSCELNPIMHIDILNKAVELAITTRGGSAPAAAQNNRQ